jgi:ABC-type multidrug transport system fused ATPase/permease subunit
MKRTVYLNCFLFLSSFTCSLDLVSDAQQSASADHNHPSGSQSALRGGELGHVTEEFGGVRSSNAASATTTTCISDGRTSQASIDEIALRMMMNTPSSFKNMHHQSAKGRLAVQTEDVCFKYKKSTQSLILNHVSLQIPEGTM